VVAHHEHGVRGEDKIHRFKGLDATVVILTGLDGMREETASALLYVGITRARSHLVIVERAEVLARWGFA
jgi:superfamily I DNA/RNA helicase